MILPDALKSLLDSGLQLGDQSSSPDSPDYMISSPSPNPASPQFAIDPQLLPTSSTPDSDGFVLIRNEDVNGTPSQEPHSFVGGKHPRSSFQNSANDTDSDVDGDEENEDDFELIGPDEGMHQDTPQAEDAAVVNLAKQTAQRLQFSEALTEDIVYHAKVSTFSSEWIPVQDLHIVPRLTFLSTRQTHWSSIFVCCRDIGCKSTYIHLCIASPSRAEHQYVRLHRRCLAEGQRS